MKRTQSGKVDGRSLSGGANRARAIDSQETAASVGTVFFAVPFAAGIIYLTWIMFQLVALTSPPPFTELFSDIWVWVSLAILIYVLYGALKGNMHAIVSLSFGLLPAIFFGFIGLIGWIFRSIF